MTFKFFAITALLSAIALAPQATRAEESKTYWGHEYSKNCEAERSRMMSKAADYALSWCRSRGGLNKNKTVMVFVVDKGQKLGSSFKTHFCEVKSDIHCN